MIEDKKDTFLERNENQYMYSFMQEANRGYEDDIALQYMGVNISFRKLNERIDQYARALIDLGVKPGEIVSICMPSTPEVVALMYALNKIGAVSNFIDLTRDDEYIKHCINNVDSKLLITYNGLLPKIGKIVDKTKLDNVVYLSALESLPLVKKATIEFLGKLSGKLPKTNFTNDSGFTGWNEFLKLAKSSQSKIVTPEYKKEQLSFIEYTSGTTGLPKAIELTNDCANLKVLQYSEIGIKYQRGDVYLNIIPVFVAFGVVMGIQLPLSLGFRDEIIASYDRNNIINYFKDIRPNHFMLVPSSYSYLVHHPKFKTLDLSHARTLGCGADALTIEQNKIIESKFREQGCNYSMTNGYGASELGAPFSTCTWNNSKPGSVGIPLPGNEVIIFKSGTFEKLGPNEIGDICMVGDYPMLKYHGDDEATERVKITLDDGRIALMLGDMGYVDEDGFIFVKGRKIDMLESNMGPVWPTDIENEILSSGLAKLCAVSNSSIPGKLKAYIEPIDNYNSIDLDLKIHMQLSEMYTDLDIEFVIVDEIPLTLTGKIDRKKLKVPELILK